MKTTIMIIAFVIGMSYANAQKIKKSEVPATVNASFAKKYPDIKSVKWEKEGLNYEAAFDLKKVETSVLIDTTGSILETESEIKINELPKPVVDFVAKNLYGQKIKAGSKIIDTKGVVTYEAAVGKRDYIFDANGQFIKKITP